MVGYGERKNAMGSIVFAARISVEFQFCNKKEIGIKEIRIGDKIQAKAVV